MIASFVCKKCEERTTRMFTKKAYTKGIVIIKCDGCEVLHLIADNLSWFVDGGTNIEKMMEEKGEEIEKLNKDGLFDIAVNKI
jgi:protein import protein ZIM17